MEDAELVKKMLSELEKKENLSSSDSPEKILDEISKTKTVSLREAIEEITAQIAFREKLHSEMMQDIESLKSTINNMTPAMSADNAKVIVEFQKKLIEAEEMKINEKLNCFRDVAQLKKELREFIREFRDKETRADLLGELISD
jgi:DNA integrity scanning protein DisA with diadenylate cyclase activity